MALDIKEHHNYVQKFPKTVLEDTFLSFSECPYTDEMKLLHVADFTLLCVSFGCFKGKC